MFKLHVLYAVADLVGRGELSWQDTPNVTYPVRSLPSGTLQDASLDTEVTVAEAAEQMIAVTDNAATDMLIDRTGRTRADTGHHDPAARNTFPTTQEVFRLGWVDPARLAQERGRHRRMSRDHRRARRE